MQGVFYQFTAAFLAVQASYDSVMLANELEYQEYCLDEEFKAQCNKAEVLVMKSSLFGRMTTGRCLPDSDDEIFTRYKSDSKFLGCYVDVLDLMTEKCTGKQMCSLKIISEIHKVVTMPCHATLSGYLKASYECITVIEPDRHCTVSVTSTAQHLMPSHSSSTQLNCGSRHQPWKLEVPLGQRINISWLNSGLSVDQPSTECFLKGYIFDKAANATVPLCSLSNNGNRKAYLSRTSSLEVYLDDSSSTGTTHPSFIRIVGVGCTDLVPPEGSWLSRRDSEAVVGCYSSRQTWHLSCVNNQWRGVIGNCTRESLELSESQAKVTKLESTMNNEVLTVMVIAFCGLIACSLIVVCGFVCLKRYSMRLNGRKHPQSVQNHLLPYQCPTTLSASHQTQPLQESI